GEIAPFGVSIHCRHGHLAQAVLERHAHGDESGAIAIVKVKKIVKGPLALFNLQAEAGVKPFLAGPTYPEVALARLALLDHPLFHDPGAAHEAVDVQAALRR